MLGVEFRKHSHHIGYTCRTCRTGHLTGDRASVFKRSIATAISHVIEKDKFLFALESLDPLRVERWLEPIRIALVSLESAVLDHPTGVTPLATMLTAGDDVVAVPGSTDKFLSVFQVIDV